jgi:hypothetical protein
MQRHKSQVIVQLSEKLLGPFNRANIFTSARIP